MFNHGCTTQKSGGTTGGKTNSKGAAKYDFECEDQWSVCKSGGKSDGGREEQELIILVSMEPITVWGLDKPLSVFSFHQWKLEDERSQNGVSFFKFESDFHVAVHGKVVGRDAYGKLKLTVQPTEIGFLRNVEAQGVDTCKKQLLIAHPGSSVTSAVSPSCTYGDTLVTIKATKAIGIDQDSRFVMDNDAALVKGAAVTVTLCFNGFYYSVESGKCGLMVQAKNYVLNE